MWNNTKWLTSHIKPTYLGHESVCWLLLSPSDIALLFIIINQPESRYSFCHCMEGRRLTCRYCECAAHVYHSGFHDQHSCPQCHSILRLYCVMTQDSKGRFSCWKLNQCPCLKKYSITDITCKANHSDQNSKVMHELLSLLLC